MKQHSSDAAEILAKATQGTEWENELWLVGGCVRDPILGEPSTPDIDIVLEGNVRKLARFLWASRISEIPPVNYSRFGTALVRVGGVNVELAMARRESYAPHSRKPSVEQATLEQDAMRRDFTINSLMRNLHSGELLDVSGKGLSDIRNRILRTPVAPKTTFRDDPLRMFRAIRFKNRLQLKPAEGLEEAIREEAKRIRIVSAERIRDELEKMLLHHSAAASLSDLMELGLLSFTIPELEAGIGVDQGSYHTKDVWQHTLDVVDRAARQPHPDDKIRLVVTLAAVFHDVGKPECRVVDSEGRVRFIGHERIGARVAASVLRRLRFSAKTSRAVSLLVEHHMRLGSAIPFTPSAARRLIRDLGDLTDPLVALCMADSSAIGRVEKQIDFRAVRQRLAEVTTFDPKTELSSPLSGEEIMEVLHCTPGPTIGRAKQMLTEAVLDGIVPSMDKAAARKYLKENFPLKQR